MRTERELKENLAKYWRQLNMACGVPDGTHPDDPNPPEPQNRLQELSLTPPSTVHPRYPSFEDVHGSLTTDPEAVEMFQDHWNDAFKPYDLGPPPSDPTGQLRWYILRDLNQHHHKRHQLDFEDAKKHRVRERVDVLFTKLAQHDPLFKLTKDVMEYHFTHIPPSSQRALQRMFTRCPHEALEFYREIRRAAEKVVLKAHSRAARRTN